MVMAIIVTVLSCTVVFLGILLYMKNRSSISKLEIRTNTGEQVQPIAIPINKKQLGYLEKIMHKIEAGNTLARKCTENMIRNNPVSIWFYVFNEKYTTFTRMDDQASIEVRISALKSCLEETPSTYTKEFESYYQEVSTLPLEISNTFLSLLSSSYPEFHKLDSQLSESDRERIKGLLRNKFMQIRENLNVLETKQRRCLSLLDRLASLNSNQDLSLGLIGAGLIATVFSGGLAAPLLLGGAIGTFKGGAEAEKIYTEIDQEIKRIEVEVEQIVSKAALIETELVHVFNEKYKMLVKSSRSILTDGMKAGLDLEVFSQSYPDLEQSLAGVDPEYLNMMLQQYISPDMTIPKDIKKTIEDVLHRMSKKVKQIA